MALLTMKKSAETELLKREGSQRDVTKGSWAARRVLPQGPVQRDSRKFTWNLNQDRYQENTA